MARILYIGDYFPQFSCESYLTEMIVRDLSSYGHEVVLLSKSWCTATKDTFSGDVMSLSKAAPFYKKYFLDPVQLRVSRLEIFPALLGLGRKVIEYEKIDQIIFADEIEYLPIVELLKKHYALPCALLFYQAKQAKNSLDNYIFPFLKDSFNALDRIYTYPIYENILNGLLSIKKGVVNVAIPFELKTQYEYKNDSLNTETVYLICTNYSLSAVKTALNETIAAFDATISKIVLCLPRGFNDQMPIDEFGDKVCISSVDLIPPSALLLWDREIRSDIPNINSIMVSLYNNWVPIINKRQYAAVSGFNYVCMNVGDFYGVSNFKAEIRSIASYFENSTC